MDQITNKSDLRAGNIIGITSIPSGKFQLSKLTNFDLDNLKLENNPDVNRERITIPDLRKIGFVPVKGARKMSLHGKSFAYVIENVHIGGGKFELELKAPIVKRLRYIDQIQNLFHALEGYELDVENLLTVDL
jgi:hypothetical protein